MFRQSASWTIEWYIFISSNVIFKCRKGSNAVSNFCFLGYDKDYKIIVQHARTNRLDIYMKTLEDQIYYYEKHSNHIIDKIYKINSFI